MNSINDVKTQSLGGLWGAIVGDALGVPAEFKSREELKKHPITDMIGFGTHDQPPGTWSDDSSLLLCTAASLIHGFDTCDLARRFVRWVNDAEWTPYGEVFDIGIATADAIECLEQGVRPEEAGGIDEYSNGNGSLMRILPVALKYYNSPETELIEYAHCVSSLTHRHPRSLMACGIYCLIAANLLKQQTLQESYYNAVRSAKSFYQNEPFVGELVHFQRILAGTIGVLSENEIKSGGYVIETLEASLWALLNLDSYSAVVLKAVNLGRDTDTTGIVTGGLAGLIYGIEGIPSSWIESLARKQEIEDLFFEFTNSITKLL